MDPTDFVKKLEGWNPKAYWDKKQWSIGYGTRAAGPNETIDENEGRRRLAAELDQSRGFVSKKYPNLAPHQAAALTSFTYNLGPGWMNSPTRLRAAIDAGDYETASKVMREYNKAGGEVLPGLVKRRDQEAAMFLGGATPPGAPQSSASSPMPAAPTGAAPAMTPYNGPSPDDVSQSRRMAQMLMQQGMSTEPVGHWTQALARVLQGGVGGMYQSQAKSGQKQINDAGNAALTQVMGSNDPKAMVPLLLGNPGTREIGEKLATSVISSQMTPKYDFLTTPGGDVVRTNKSAGTAERVIQSNNLKATLSPGETALDQAYAKDHVDFVQGGAADARKGIEQLQGVIQQLEATATGKSKTAITGPTVGRLPDAVAAYTNPEAIAARDRVGEIVQRNLKTILGAQFTQKEGDALIARAYNPALEEGENAARLKALLGTMEKAIAAKQAAAEYFEKNGTLKGFKGSTRFTVDDIIRDAKLGNEPVKGAPPPAGAQAPAAAAAPLAPGAYEWTPEGLKPAQAGNPAQGPAPAAAPPTPPPAARPRGSAMNAGPAAVGAGGPMGMPNVSMPRQMTPEEAMRLQQQGLNQYGIPIGGIR
jgi:GH24 family phage-related lysozyme (muramidase)